MRTVLAMLLLMSMASAQQQPLVPMPGKRHNHPKRTIAMFWAGGAAVGVTVGLLTRLHHCPSVINGYPYDGTPGPHGCPGKNYDPRIIRK